jgi:hypothetical protein
MGTQLGSCAAMFLFFRNKLVGWVELFTKPIVLQRSELMGFASAQPILRALSVPNLFEQVALLILGGYEMEDKSTCDTYSNGNDPAPSPVRDNTKGEYHEACQ